MPLDCPSGSPQAPAPGGWLGKLASVVREFGPMVATLYLFDRALRALHHRNGLYVYELMRQPIDGSPLLPERLARNIAVREIDAADPAVQRMPARPEVKQARFAAGARCLGVERKGTLLGYIWFREGTYDEDEVRCTYCLPPAGEGAPPTSVFDFDLYLFPEHRMGVGFVAVWHAASRYLHEVGVRSSYSRMTRFNLASRRAHLRLGSVVVGRAFFLCLGSLQFMVATLPPFVAITAAAHRRVGLCLPAAPLQSARLLDTEADAR